MGLFVDPKRTMEYVPFDERGKDPAQRVVFLTRVLTAGEYEERKDAVRYVDEMSRIQVKQGTWQLYTLRAGIRGVRDPLGRIQWDADELGRPTGAFLDRLHPDLRKELAHHIESESCPTDAEVKV